MNKNQVKGAAKMAVGKVQRKVGEAVGSPKQQGKGLLKEIVGAFQKGYGDSQKAQKDDRTADRKVAKRKSAKKKTSR